MLKRKIYGELLHWKQDSKGRRALLIDGARRVGKSYICREFAKREYKSSIIIDFANVSQDIIELFEKESYDLNLFFIKLSAFYGVRLEERKSLIVFDEVQLFPKARQLIKYLVEDGRYDYLETGSLLSLKRNIQDIVLPSEERHIHLFPLDFEEFLWAMGEESAMEFIQNRFENKLPLGQALHRKMLNLFRQYILVGGMPQAVTTYIEKKDFAEVDKIKRDILTLYRNDIGKFAGNYQNKVLAIFDELPSQLIKKEKKYVLADISKQARFREYEDAFMWLEDAMITNTCFNATEPGLGLFMNSDFSTRKSYMADTGLLVTHSFYHKSYLDNELYKAILFDKMNINEGMLMENIVAQMLRAAGHRLFFYSRHDVKNRKNHMEIDFLINIRGKTAPVEVKSSVYRKHSSLDKFQSKFQKNIGQSYILYQKDVMQKDGVWHLPIYMGGLL